MELYVYNSNFERVGMIDVYDTAIFNWSYIGISKLKLLVPYNKYNAQYLRIGNILMKNSTDWEEAFEIQFIRYNKNNRGYSQIELEVISLVSWLSRRVLNKNYHEKSTLATAFTKLCNLTMFTGTQAIANFYVSADNLTDEIEYSFDIGMNLLDAIKQLCLFSGLGMKVLTSPITNKSKIVFYSGKFIGENTLENIIFSDEYGNILSSDYTIDYINHKNRAYTKMDDEKLMYFSSTNATGENLKECFINTNVKREYKDESEQTITLTQAQYTAAISSELKANLTNFEPTEVFKCEIDANNYFKFKIDFNLGDIVTCINKEWDIKNNYKIDEVVEVYSKGGYKLDIKFGTQQNSLFSNIKLIKR